MNLKNENGNIKIIAIVAVIIIAIIVGVVCIVKNNANKDKTVTEIKQDPYEYFAVYSLDGTVGVIDKTGKQLIDSKYTHIYIPNKSKDVFFCINGDEYKILNKEGQDLFTDFESVSTIVISDATLEMEKNVLSYDINGKYGLVDYEGNKLTNAIYDEVSSLKNKPGCILVKKDNLYGVLDSSGKTIIDVKYNSIKGDEYNTEKEGYQKTGYIVSERTDNGIIYGYIDYNGEMLIEPRYESISRVLEYNSEDIYLIVMEAGKKGVIENTKLIIKPRFQAINYYDVSKTFIVNKNGKYGFYDNDGDEILAPEYTSYSIAGNYICVKKAETMQLYDLHGNLVNTNTYKSILETGNEAFFIAQDQEGYYSIISKDYQTEDKYTNISYAFDNFFVFTNEEGKSGVLDVYTGIEVQPEYDYILVLQNARALEARIGDEADIYSENIEKILTMSGAVVEKVADNYTAIYSENDLVYIDNTGKIVENTEIFKDLELYSYKSEDGKWGFVNANKEIVLEPKYDVVTELNEYGFAGIYLEGKWGVVDKTGKVVVEPKYEIETYYSPSFVGKYLLEEVEDIHCLEVGDQKIETINPEVTDEELSNAQSSENV